MIDAKELLTVMEKNLVAHMKTYNGGTWSNDLIMIHKDCPLYHNVDIMVKNYKLQKENKKDVEQRTTGSN